MNAHLLEKQSHTRVTCIIRCSASPCLTHNSAVFGADIAVQLMLHRMHLSYLTPHPLSDTSQSLDVPVHDVLNLPLRSTNTHTNMTHPAEL